MIPFIDLKPRDERQREIITAWNAATFWKNAAFVAAMIGLAAGFISGLAFSVQEFSRVFLP